MALVNHEASVEGQRIRSEQRPQKQGLPVVSLVIGALSFVGIIVSIWMAFLYAPTDAIEGDVQRIFYFHVPLLWVGMLSFGVLTVAGLGYIVTKKESWDWAARAAAELSAIFITLGTILGSIWGKATWGTWWTWDPKLTATFILWFMCIGYLMLRSYMGRTSASAHAGAVLSVVGIIDVPIIYLSVQWWRGQHPTAEVGVSHALPPSVTLTLMVALVAFTLLYAFLMTQLYQLQRLQTLAQRLRASIE